MHIKNLEYWYLFNKYSPKTQNFDFFLYFINEKFNKNAKVEQLTNVDLSHGEEKGLIVKDPLLGLVGACIALLKQYS